jgi:pyrimidine-nucleoside phosphorylase
MSYFEMIAAKRDGGRLTDDEIQWLISEYSADRIPDYQMASMLMAVFKEGLDTDELAAWTEAMLHSGEVLDFSDIPEPKIDKHSTGGVGDKVSIPLAPLVASCGIAIPMISGRGLGHTGGTLDKLESIPDFRTSYNSGEFSRLVERHGLVMAGQSAALAPADQRLYALRDVTGTVPSIPLIASSIMSKKLAEGIDGLVLDVKVGTGAFMKRLDLARDLAKTMVEIGSAHETKVTALITEMSQPLGREIGNASEMRESLEILKGGGPHDVVEVTMRLGVEMLLLGGVESDPVTARRRLEQQIASGAAFEKFEEIVIAQGGDPAVLHDPSLLAQAPDHHPIHAHQDGYIQRADAFDFGVGAVRLGAGRATKEDSIDPAVGITVEVKVGDEVAAGQLLATLHHRGGRGLDEALRLSERAISIGDEAIETTPLVIEEVR